MARIQSIETKGDFLHVHPRGVVMFAWMALLLVVLGVLAFLWWRERPAPHARAWAAMLAVFAIALLPTFFLPLP